MSKERRQGLLFAVAGMVVNFGRAIGKAFHSICCLCSAFRRLAATARMRCSG
jgi:hypothetical protein